MKIEFTIEERILMFSMLPAKADYHTLKEVQEARKALTFTEEETRKYDITTAFPTLMVCNSCAAQFGNETGQVPSAISGKYSCPTCESEDYTVLSEDRSRQNVTFNKEVSEDYVSEIDIKPRALASVVNTLQSLNEKMELTEQYMPLYEKLVL